MKNQSNGRDWVFQTDIPPKGIKQRLIEAWIVFSGLAADRPNGTTETKVYFSTDTNSLSIWNGTAWKSVTLA